MRTCTRCPEWWPTTLRRSTRWTRRPIVTTFAADALVNDARREFWGTDAIRGWVAKEMVGDRISIEVVEVIDHHGLTVVRGRYDGHYDKTNLPGEVILTNYFTATDGKIDSLIVIRNMPI